MGESRAENSIFKMPDGIHMKAIGKDLTKGKFSVTWGEFFSFTTCMKGDLKFKNIIPYSMILYTPLQKENNKYNF